MNHSAARKILGVDSTADQAAIKTAYRRLAAKHHPDKGGDESKFKEIRQAYEVLQTAEKHGSSKFKYDFDFGEPSWNDFFKDKVGKNKYNEDLKKKQEREFGGKSISRMQFTCSLEDAFNGCTKSVNLGVHGVRSVVVPPGSLDDSIVDVYNTPDGTSIVIHVRVEAPPETTVDWGMSNFSYLGNVTKVLNLSPLMLIAGGFQNVKMIDGSTVKVYIPPGTKANTLLKVESKGFWKNFKNQTRGNCLLRVIPEIKRLVEYSEQDILEYVGAYCKELNNLPVAAAHVRFQRLIKMISEIYQSNFSAEPEDPNIENEKKSADA